jgi:hypothetical protein
MPVVQTLPYFIAAPIHVRGCQHIRQPRWQQLLLSASLATTVLCAALHYTTGSFPVQHAQWLCLQSEELGSSSVHCVRVRLWCCLDRNHLSLFL